LRYGVLTNEQSVVLVNIIGSTLFLVYTLIYYVFTVNKRACVKQFGFSLTVLVVVIIFTNRLEDQRDRMIHVTGMSTSLKLFNQSQVCNLPNYIYFDIFSGIVCCIVTVCFFAAPLASLLHVIRAKNSESLPLPLIATSFLVSLQWLIYGILISDSFIQVTHFPPLAKQRITDGGNCLLCFSDTQLSGLHTVAAAVGPFCPVPAA